VGSRQLSRDCLERHLVPGADGALVERVLVLVQERRATAGEQLIKASDQLSVPAGDVDQNLSHRPLATQPFASTGAADPGGGRPSQPPHAGSKRHCGLLRRAQDAAGSRISSSSSSARSSTRPPSTQCSGSVNSSGEWLMPPRLGTNTIAEGVNSPMTMAS